MNLLFVCTFNICRSVLAERLARRELELRASDFTVQSAGTHAVPGEPMHPYVTEVLRQRGASCDGFTSRRLASADVSGADLILTATTAHRDDVIAASPDALRKTFALKEFLRLAAFVPTGHHEGAALVQEVSAMRGRTGYVKPIEDDIPDPPATMAAFESCAAVLGTSISGVLDTICKRG